MIDERIKFRHLQCFLAVAQHGSLQKAADVLSVTQPAISKTLKELEALLGARLFERGRRGAVLTRPGEAFQRHAGTSVSALREAVASVSQTRHAGRAVLTVGVLPTVVPWLMPRLLLELDRVASPEPASSMRVYAASNPELLTQLRQRELDLVIGRFAEPAQMLGLAFEHLYADPLALAVRPGHPLLKLGDPMQQLGRFAVVLPMPGTAIRQTADSFFATRGVGQPVRAIETLSVSLSRGYTAGSDAVWCGPLGALRPDFDAGTLVPLHVGMEGTEEMVGLTLRADMVPSSAQQELIRAVRKLAAERQGLSAPRARSG
ncbi:MAG: pca operon transcription factor PcaQ [Pseudomonadota bacterium]